MMNESDPNTDVSFGVDKLDISGDGPSQLDDSVGNAEEGAKVGGRAGRGRAAAAREGTKFYGCRVSDMVRWYFGHFTIEEQKEFKSGEARCIAAVLDIDGDRLDVVTVEPGVSVALTEFKHKMKGSVAHEEEEAWWSSCVRDALQQLCFKHGVGRAKVRVELSRRGVDGKWSAISSPRVVVEYGPYQPQHEHEQSALLSALPSASSASSAAAAPAAAPAAQAAPAAAPSSSSGKLTKDEYNQKLIDHFLEYGVSRHDSDGDLLPESRWQPSPYEDFAYPCGNYYVMYWHVLQGHSFFSQHPPTSGDSKE